MAIRYETLFVVVPVKDSWFDMCLQLGDKDVCLHGKDKNDGPPIWVEKGDYKNYDSHFLCLAYEQSRGDKTYNQIIGEGLDDEGKRYVIIDRRETYDGNKLNELSIVK